MSDFPPAGMIDKEDSQYFTVKHQDKSVRFETDGGYVVTRPRSTRRARRVYTTGFTDISDADMNLLRDFYESKHGGADIFTWTVPTSGTEIQVRFKGDLSEKYTGAGGFHRWTLSQITLEEV